MKTNSSISSNALEYLKHFLAPTCKIVDLQVRNKWLVATLSSGVYFWVLNI
jgi:hypothetical protein